jgi:SAM-dependent methyltransferase
MGLSCDEYYRIGFAHAGVATDFPAFLRPQPYSFRGLDRGVQYARKKLRPARKETSMQTRLDSSSASAGGCEPHGASDGVSSWVRRFASLIPAGEVLDLACGNGRHARYLAGLGYEVVALDRDPDALAQAAGPGISTAQIELEAPDAMWPFAGGRFAGVIVTNYLHRPLVDSIVASLAPDGVLIYETFAAGNAQFGKPSNPHFLLTPGELLVWAAAKALQVVAFEEGRIDTPRPAMVQRLCAVRADFPREAALLTPFFTGQ